MDQNIEATVKLWQDNVKEPDLAAELSELVDTARSLRIYEQLNK